LCLTYFNLNVLFIGGLNWNRKKGFRFDDFKQESGKNITNDWLAWFIGLYEGDGYMNFSNKGFSFAIYSIDKKNIIRNKTCFRIWKHLLWCVKYKMKI